MKITGTEESEFTISRGSSSAATTGFVLRKNHKNRDIEEELKSPQLCGGGMAEQTVVEYGQGLQPC